MSDGESESEPLSTIFHPMSDVESGSDSDSREKKRAPRQTGPKVFSEYAEMAKRIGRLYNQADHADIVLEVGDEDPPRKLHAHRAILAASSDYFNALLMGGYKEAKQTTIPVKEVDPDAFELVLEFIYKGQAEISSDIALGVHAIATRFQVEGLKLAAEKCIAASMSKDQVVALLDSARQWDAPYVVQQCVEYIVKHANQVFKSGDLTLLPKDILLQLVSDDKLSADEISIFRGLMRWAEKNRGEQSMKEVLEPLLGHVRYGLIEPQDIRTYVMPAQVVPSEWILESLLFQTAPVDGEEKLNPRLKERNSVAGGSFMWDKKRCNSNITISKRNRLATSTQGSWITVATTRTVSKGKHFVEFQVKTHSNIMIGVCEIKTLNPQTQGGAYTTAGGYMYLIGSHQCYHASSNTTPNAAGNPKGKKTILTNPAPFQQKDKIGCLLDLNKGTIEFFVRGKSMGIAYKGVPKGKYVFCSDMYQSNEVSIVKSASDADDDEEEAADDADAAEAEAEDAQPKKKSRRQRKREKQEQAAAAASDEFQ
eukprot:TRINITY_DN303_c0_g1_i2.p1 TRINITY_DN303_c0_g1~~TRINITY_DN303_c0_g1_i2.p1  ORF type:complete len:538 (-),score=137.84 TRINITY_DN303_c0_g1_i2:210-1823(-)